MFQTEVVMGATWLTGKVPRDPPEMWTVEVRPEAGRCGGHEALCSAKGARGVISDVCVLSGRNTRCRESTGVRRF